MGRKIEQSAAATGGAQLKRKRADKIRLATEEQRALEMGFLALAKEVAQENAETLRLLAKH